ncbi:uncharacterized protein LOC115970083 [Quercus lobata]|uniref:uncharacterized protein LOC115970083 n=1 Tax=Quercus lobata TaxID=97700 RepID=UPI001248618A|nr:uncharacterized protein LOC115970083 [Quercus lobata]
MDGKSVGVISLQEPLSWMVYVDGATNHKGSGVGLVLISPNKITIEKSLRLVFSTMTNEAEYEALLVGMTVVQKMGGKTVEIFSDSRLVVGQVKGSWRHKILECRNICVRSRNAHADSLATLATFAAQGLPRVILMEDLCKPYEEGRHVVHVHQIRAGPNWMDLIMLFLKEDVLPESKFEADKIRRKTPWFWLSRDRKLYKRSFSGPYLLCVHPEAVELLLEELHEGIYGSHTGVDLYLTELSHKWSLDIVGPFPKATGNKRYLLVGTDYFKKWVEAEPLANIRDVDVKIFLWKNIVTRFGVPQTLISNNGLQFYSKAFRRYCCDQGITNRYSTSTYLQGNGQAEAVNKVIGITNKYSTPAYPQGNGQVEAVNKVIVSGLKKRLDDAKWKWVEELSHVLWAYRTTPRRSTGETPFSMTYGAKTVIPLETRFPTLRSNSFIPSKNDELLEKSLDLIKERRENTMVQLAYYQNKVKQRYDANIKLRPLTVGDLVLRKVLGTIRNPAWGKLGPNWEGSYCITSAAGIGAYYLEDLEEKAVARPWNV